MRSAIASSGRAPNRSDKTPTSVIATGKVIAKIKARKLASVHGAGVNRIVKCDDSERSVWAGAHQFQQSRPGRIGTSQLVLAIASANVLVFHNGENIAVWIVSPSA